MNMQKYFLVSLVSVICFAGCKDQTKQQPALTDQKEQSMNLTAPDTSKQLMPEDDFWNIIDRSRSATPNDYQAQITSLKTILLTLEPADIEKFDHTFTALLAASYDWKLWGAAYVINGGCSDDCFDYFRQYLVAHGKEKFYETLHDPETCANWIKSEEEENWEGLQYAAFEAYKQKTGTDIPQQYNPKFELKGKRFDEETVMKQYPKLAKKFMGN
jgi:hypothetical protein